MNGTEEAYKFLKQCKTYYLATCEGDQPRVRPFGTVDLFEGKLYFQTGARKAVSAQLNANPRLEICAFAPNGEWIRVAAEAVLDPRIEAQKHLLAAYPELAGMYQPGDGNTEVYYLKNASVTIASFTAPPKTYSF